jgi:uncharacterized lipoprotein YbaY
MRKMKFGSTLLATTLLAALFLTACGEKAEEATAPAVEEAAPAAEAAAPAAEEAAPAEASSEAGGYVPTEEERVPGITEEAPAAAAE